MPYGSGYQKISVIMKHLRVTYTSVGTAAIKPQTSRQKLIVVVVVVSSRTWLPYSTKMFVMNIHVDGTQNQSKCEFKVSLSMSTRQLMETLSVQFTTTY